MIIGTVEVIFLFLAVLIAAVVVSSWFFYDFWLVDAVVWLVRQIRAGWRGEEREPFALTVGGALLVVVGGVILAYGVGTGLVLGVTPPLGGVLIGVAGAAVARCGFYLLDKRMNRIAEEKSRHARRTTR